MGAGRAGAVELEPFATRNQSPLVAVHGLPPAESGATVPPGRLDVRVSLDAANHFAADRAEDELVRLDGESYRITGALRYGLPGGLEVGVDVPWVAHTGGVADGFIEAWHRWFGLPGNGRDEVERGRLDFLYLGDGDKVHLDRSSQGLGDVRVTLAVPLPTGPRRGRRFWAARAGLKLPTGASGSRLRGSGGTDLSLALAATDRATLAPWGVVLHASGGVAWLGRGEVLAERRRRLVGFGSATVGWSPAELLGFQVQLDAHTAPYRSRVDPLGSGSVQLVLGGTLALPGAARLELAVVEDVAVDTAPDVVFHLALRKRF
ncbi:MAG: DUF3187 family protein [Deferrisomatales bacterium]